MSWEHLAKQAQYRPRQMANLCAVSLRTVQRHFRKHYSLCVTEWLRDVRMEEAKRRILAGDSIKAVAIDLGFKQLSHFSHVFKATFGIAPSFFAGEKKCHLPMELLDVPRNDSKAGAVVQWM